MKISGIICEYNPFHNGHEYLIREAKKTADVVVAVMSGNFVQRGDVAIVDKYVRAKSAILGGADLVLELPFPFCSASAAYFAEAGVRILSMAGADTLVFGSECGDISRLSTLADYSLSEDFIREKKNVAVGEGSASAHFQAFCQNGETLHLLPNDILAVEYLRAIKKAKCSMETRAILRMGDGFSEEMLGKSAYSSATALRKALREERLCLLDRYMPKDSHEALCLAVERGEAPASLELANRAVLGFFRLTPPNTLINIAGLGNGLEYRLCDCAGKSTSIEDFFSMVSTKRYTDATIRRAVLAAMLGVVWDDLDRGVAYSTLLGANQKGRTLLSALRKKNLPIVTKPSDINGLCARFPKNEREIRRQAELSWRADALYTLCLPRVEETGKYLRGEAVIF